MKKKWISISWFLLLAFYGTAQKAGYTFQCKLDSIKSSGFYNIEITPELSAHIKTDFNDLRIINDSGKWVPHILNNPSYEIVNEAVIYNLPFVITENSRQNTILVATSKSDNISNIGLRIRNTAAERYGTLSGSDNNKDWFVINDSIILNPVVTESKIISTFRIDFPPSTYRYIKLTIHNNNKDPFNITGTEYYTGAVFTPGKKFIQNPATTIIQKDSNKTSYIKIIQQQRYHFDNISLKISGVKYFNRQAGLYIPGNAHHSYTNPGQLVHSFTISNNSTLQFKIPLNNVSVFYILINNEDNLPLKINDVATSSANRYITSYLEKGNSYALIMGNSTATAPNYDLADIKTKITDSIRLLTTEKVIPLNEPVITVAPEKNNTWILWTVIIAALFILLFFTRKMLQEVNKRKENDSI